MDKIWDRNPSKSQNQQKSNAKNTQKLNHTQRLVFMWSLLLVI